MDHLTRVEKCAPSLVAFKDSETRWQQVDLPYSGQCSHSDVLLVHLPTVDVKLAKVSDASRFAYSSTSRQEEAHIRDLDEKCLY